MTRGGHLGWACGLGSVWAWVYGAHVWRAGFVYEDAIWVATARPAVRPRGLAHLLWALSGSPQAVHLVSLGLGLVLAVAVWGLARRLGRSPVAAWGAAGLVLLHPGMIESLAYGAAQPELIAAIGVVGACLVATGPVAWWRVPVVGGAVVLGIGGKETALVACGLVPLTLWAVRSHWAELAGWGGALLVVVAVLVAGGPAAVANGGEAPGLRVGAGDWLGTQSAAAGRLLGVAVTGTGMTVDPDVDRVSGVGRSVSGLAYGALGVIGWRLRHAQPGVTHGIAWCLGSLLPRLVVQTPRSALNEHQFLVPLLGLVLAAAAAWDGPEGRAG